MLRKLDVMLNPWLSMALSILMSSVPACLPICLLARTCRKDEFWIACDLCDMWWCGRCSKVRLLLSCLLP